MAIDIYGAFRTDTSLDDNTVSYATAGSTFQISAYSKITISDGADGTIIDGDNITNEQPNDATQTYGGKAITWDYTIEVTDGVNTYQIGIIDYDINSSGDMNYPGAEQGYFIAFTDGAIPPLNTTLTVGAVTDNGPSIPVDTVVPCFVSGTLIDTQNGWVPIEELSVGDAIVTLDSGMQEILWIGSRQLTLRDLIFKSKLFPVRIERGALGHDVPSSDLLVSRQHRLFVQSEIAEKMFGCPEILAAAHHFVGIDGVKQDRSILSVKYHHILLPKHEIIKANGAWVESLFTGKESIRSIGKVAAQQVAEVMPQIMEPNYDPRPARFVPYRGTQTKNLIRRHLKNGKPFLCGISETNSSIVKLVK